MACPKNSRRSDNAVVNRSPFVQYVTRINGQQLESPIVLQPGDELALDSPMFSVRPTTVGYAIDGATPIGGVMFRAEWFES